MDDDRLLQEISQLLRRADPAPPEVTLAARSAPAWRPVDASPAELLDDSALEAAPLTDVRWTATGWRAPSVEEPEGLLIEVEISAERSRRAPIGQIVPPSPAKVIQRFPGAGVSVSADELGRFGMGGLEAGPLSLRCAVPEGGAIETGWVAI